MRGSSPPGSRGSSELAPDPAPTNGTCRSQVGRDEHHQHRRVTEVVLQEPGPTIVRRIRRHDRDRSRGAANVPRALPDPSEVAELIAVGHQHEVPRLPVLRRRREPARLEDLAKSSSLTGADENSRTLRRDLNASQVSTPSPYDRRPGSVRNRPSSTPTPGKSPAPWITGFVRDCRP